MEQQPFHVGQKVVAVKTVIGFYKKGNKYEVLGVVYHCKEWFVDIGLIVLGGTCCPHCLFKMNKNSSHLCYAKDFVPIQDQYSDLTREIAEGLKETKETPDKILIPETINN